MANVCPGNFQDDDRETRWMNKPFELVHNFSVIVIVASQASTAVRDKQYDRRTFAQQEIRYAFSALRTATNNAGRSSVKGVDVNNPLSKRTTHCIRLLILWRSIVAEWHVQGETSYPLYRRNCIWSRCTFHCAVSRGVRRHLQYCFRWMAKLNYSLSFIHVKRDQVGCVNHTRHLVIHAQWIPSLVCKIWLHLWILRFSTFDLLF